MAAPLTSVSLRTKVIIPVVLILVVAFTLIAYGTAHILKGQLKMSSERTALRLSETAELAMQRAMMSGSSSEMAEVIREMGRQPEIPRIALRRTDGQYLVDTGRMETDEHGKTVAPPPGASEVTNVNRRNQSFLRVTSAIANEKRCHSCHTSNIRTLGFLELEVETTWLTERIRQTHRLIAAVAGLSLLLVGLVIAFSMNVAVISPIKRLARGISSVYAGERSVQIEPAFDDEIGQLGFSFNRMVGAVAAAEGKLVEKERQLAEAEKLAGIGLMAAGIAHEINNPLAAVSVAAETLTMSGLSEDHRARLSNSVYEGAQRIQKIVCELLTLDTKQGLDIRPHPTDEVLRHALHSVDVPASIRVHFRASSTLPPVVVDISKMTRGLANIIKNAVQAMPEGGSMTIEAHPIDGQMEVLISDTGTGMPPEVLEHVFDPFFSTREVGRGFGLGLAVAHGTITQHGGSVSAQSTPGEGTTFRVFLPIQEQECDA